MTGVHGLRLAYRGFVTGLAAGYAWLAAAMVLAALLERDALAPLRPFVAIVLPRADRPDASAFVLGFALVQLASAFLGMAFAYFFGRFFTVRATVAIAAPCFAILAWALVAAAMAARAGDPGFGMAAAPLVGTLAWGVLLGAGVPLRGEVARGPEGA